MKLSLLVIIMDLLTLLADPIINVDSRLRKFSKPKEIGMLPRFKKGLYAYRNN